MIRILSKILFFLSSLSILPPPKKDQIKILETIAKKYEDVPLFLRNSLRQYDCHGYYFLKPIWLGFNIFSMLVFVPLLFLLLLRSFKTVVPQKTSNIALNPKVFKNLRDLYHPVFVKKPIGYLKKREWSVVFQILRFGWRHPYFIFRTIWKVAVYSELVDTYLPEKIWVTQEMVFESSLITHYLSDFTIEHMNYMHGESFFSIQVAFSTFSEFYVWDEYYADLFRSLHVTSNKYNVFSPLERTTSSFKQKNILKYYNQDTPNAKKFNRILGNLMKFAHDKNCELIVRLHPLHKKESEISLIKARGIKIEENAIDIVDSIMEARYICSEFSSVLYIASLLNRDIVIDNSFQERMDLIIDLEPIFIKKLPHEFLVNSVEMSRK